MEIPKSLQSTWNVVNKDNNISQDDFNKLVEAAAPNRSNEEFDLAEIEFLSALRSEINAKGSYNTGEADAEMELDFNDVPETLQNVWNEISSDNNISQDDFTTLLNAAAPNMQDNELDTDEFNFLSSLKDKMVETGSIDLHDSHYDQESIQNFKDKFKDKITDPNAAIPVLKPEEAKKIAQNLNFNSVKDLQTAIGAKVDNKYGPETDEKLTQAQKAVE